MRATRNQRRPVQGPPRVTSLQLAAIGSVEPNILHHAGRSLRAGLGIAVHDAVSIPIPLDAFDPVRGQYGAVALLRAATGACPAPPVRLIALTEVDLYIPMLTFVFGQAQLGGCVGVVSLARLRPEFYALRADDAILYKRLTKELLHESGHLFGLVHCTDRRCPMSLSTSILEVDMKTDTYCPACSVLLAEQIRVSGDNGCTTETSS
jgi:archaemetzincin